MNKKASKVPIKKKEKSLIRNTSPVKISLTHKNLSEIFEKGMSQEKKTSKRKTGPSKVQEIEEIGVIVSKKKM